VRTVPKSFVALFVAAVLGVPLPVFLTRAQVVGGLSSAPPTSPTSSTPINLAGIVLNAASGVPISRALVQINGRAMLTDHEGKFEFDQFGPATTAILEVRKPGFYLSTEMGASSLTLRSNQLAAPVVVRLYPEALITGTLTAPDGTPLSQVLVNARRSAYNDGGHQWFVTANSITNSRGEFRLAVPPGDYRIETNFSPRLRGSGNAILPLVVPAAGASIHMSGGTEQHFDLRPVVSRTYTVALRIDPLPERGFPMILARSGDGSVFPANVIRSGPDAGDDMRVALPSGTYTLIANVNMGENTQYGETMVTITDQNLSGVTLHMSPVAPIPVQVVVDPGATSDKTPPTPQQLGLMMQNAQETMSRMGSNVFMVASAGDRGAYLRPTPGIYRLSARGSGQWFIKSATYGTTDLLQQEMTVAAGAGSFPVVVTVSDQMGGLQGAVKLNGSPGSAWIYVIPTGTSAVPFYTNRSGMDGSFNVPNLPPGSYQVIAFENRHMVDYRDPKTLAPFTTYVRSVTVSQGNKATVDLDAVTDTELKP